MLQMGGDFGFGDANAWFKNLDILLAAVNKEGRVNVSLPQAAAACSRGRFFAARNTHTRRHETRSTRLACHGAGVSSLVRWSARSMLIRNRKLLRFLPLRLRRE